MEESTLINKPRLDHIDIFRGIGIIYMIIGHVRFGWTVDKYIHGFHMPMFLFISGYFFNIKRYNSIKQLIRRKAKNLLVPYLYFGLIHYLIWLFYIGINEKLDLLKYLSNLFWINTSGEMPIAGALWFLTCLFLVEILFFFLTKVLVKRAWIAIGISIVSLAGSLIPRYLDIRFPFAGDVAMAGIGIFYVGNLVRKYSEDHMYIKKLNITIFKTLVLFLISGLLIFVNGYVNMRTAEYSIIPLFYINAIISILAYWNISKLSTITNFILVKISVNILKYIGKNSIIYLCLNQLVILLLQQFSSFVLIDSVLILLFIRTLIFISSILLLYMLTEFITKTKIKFLIGK
ncbi:acyltransferase family protein [Paenibacillus wynnii]|uniref:acyltransferase family protein n=1 Tax=Paenibacillus wynnii TaxID=268407 RepID=UPI00278E549D|nr:acyltransferase family protein [Paenibacillus wynnii]MDQ0196274.1 fucose 4-O-acetylase-like acetyltransferase [Paenibacillus wynnii]